MSNDKGDLNVLEMLQKIRMEPDAKKVFLAMQREDQLLAMLGIQAYNVNETAKALRAIDELEKKVATNERKAVAYRKAREEKEGETIDFDSEGTPMTQKIVTTVKKRFDQLITMGLLIYLIFGDKVEKMVSP